MIELLKWKPNEESNIIHHIDKHIINIHNNEKIKKEVSLWEEEFKRKGKNLEELKLSYNKVKPKSELYTQYNLIANETIGKAKDIYLFKSFSSYSANYAQDNGLTTCLQIDFSKDYYDKIKIASCFYRQSTVMNSTIIYTVKKMLEGVPKEQLYVIEGVKTNVNVYKKAIQNSLYDSTNKENPILLVRRFIFYYLKAQFDYYFEYKKENKEELQMLSYIIRKLNYMKFSKEEDKKLCETLYMTEENFANLLINKLIQLEDFKKYDLFDTLDIDCEQILIELCLKIIKEKYNPKNELLKSLIKKGLIK